MNPSQCWKANLERVLFSIVQYCKITVCIVLCLDQTAAAEDVGGPFHMQNTSFLVNAAQMETSR